jgi:arylamine N-acetyltransferase
MAGEVLGIMELANKGTWFDGEWQAAIEDENKTSRKMQQGYGTRSLIEKYKDKRIKIHRRKKKERMNMELENMELLRKQHECRKFYKEINMARKQVKPRVNMCTSRNEEGSLISSG